MDKHQSCMLFLVLSGVTAVMQLYDGNCEGKLELKLVRTHKNSEVKHQFSTSNVQQFGLYEKHRVSHWAAYGFSEKSKR